MIPKILHLCWMSGDEYPSLIKNCIDSWKAKCPDYEIRIWNTETFDINNSVWVKQAYEKKKYAFAADYIRLWAVYHYGGIYLDSDVEVVKSFDDLLSFNSFMGFACDGNYEPAIFGATKNCQWLKECLEYYTNRNFVKSNNTLDLTTLPKIIESFFIRKYGLITEQKDKIKNVLNGELTLFPTEYFGAHHSVVNTTENTYAIHLFNGSWYPPTMKIQILTVRFILRRKWLFWIYKNTYQKIKTLVKNKR